MHVRFVTALAVAWLVPAFASAQTASPSPAANASPSPTPTLSPDDQKLLEEIQKAEAPKSGAADTGSTGGGAAAAAGQPAERGSTAGLLSNVYNPALSVNGLFLATGASSDRPDPTIEEQPSGISVQELEMQFLANVDPYFQANLMLSSPGGNGIGLEEGFVQPFWQPYGFSFRFGQIKEPFGRENAMHTHALPFVDKSLVGFAIFGDEGLAEPSIEATWLSPLPWYAVLYLTAMDGQNQSVFGSTRGSDLAGFAAMKNLIDISDDATIELQASYTAGKNKYEYLSQVYGGDFVLKWKPARMATTRSLLVQGEVMAAHEPTAPAKSKNPGGAYGLAQWQLAKRWFVAGRYDYLGFNAAEAGITRRESAILAMVPTEFSAIRLQLSDTQPPFGAKDFVQGYLQFNFTIGAHPAHAY